MKKESNSKQLAVIIKELYDALVICKEIIENNAPHLCELSAVKKANAALKLAKKEI